MIPFRVAETPEKFLESGSKCYTCTSLCTVNEKSLFSGKMLQILQKLSSPLQISILTAPITLICLFASVFAIL